MHPNRLRARRLAVANVLGMMALSAAACSNVKDTLLDAPIPTIIDPSAANSAAGADALRIGALSRLRGFTAGSGSGDSPWMFSGLLTDEWKSSDTFSQRNETDQRSVQDNNANLTPVLRDLYRARTSSREAINSLTTYAPAPAANIGQMWLVMGLAETYLAEWFCNGTPLGDASTGTPESTAPLTNAEVFTLANAHFDSALATTSATDAFTVSVKNAASVAKGHVLIDLGKFPEAAAAVASVPTNFQLLSTFSLTSGSNQIWSLGQSAKRWTVGDSFDASGIIKNALPFASAKDPRLPVTGTTLGTSPAGRGFDGATNLVFTTLWGRTDPTPILSGLDARLIEAEAKLKAGDIAGMIAILNALRATPQNLGANGGVAQNSPVMSPLTAPTTQSEAINLFFREKAFWTFSRGQRLGDLRRLIRQYGRTQDNVFPTGTFFKGGNYGSDVNFPVTVDEQNNTLFKACMDRNA